MVDTVDSFFPVLFLELFNAMIIRPLIALLTLMAWLGPANAQVCPNPRNLVTNCGFDLDTVGYSPQLPGDSLAHVANLGVSALGAMRVVDSQADGDSEAEAEACVNLGSVRHFRLHAQFLAVNADACFVGFDEFTGPDCVASNGQYVSSPDVAVNAAGFTAFAADHAVGAEIQSVELVILCQLAGGGDAEFVVDDLGLFSNELFADSFE